MRQPEGAKYTERLSRKFGCTLNGSVWINGNSLAWSSLVISVDLQKKQKGWRKNWVLRAQRAKPPPVNHLIDIDFYLLTYQKVTLYLASSLKNNVWTDREELLHKKQYISFSFFTHKHTHARSCSVSEESCIYWNALNAVIIEVNQMSFNFKRILAGITDREQTQCRCCIFQATLASLYLKNKSRHQWYIIQTAEQTQQHSQRC